MSVPTNADGKKAEDAAAAVATPLPRKKPGPQLDEELCCASSAFGCAYAPSSPSPAGATRPTATVHAGLAVSALITSDLATLDLWYHRFSARAIACRRRDTVLATLLAVSSCVLATLGGIPALSGSSNGPLLAGVGAGVALVALICQAVGRVCQWDTGALQCRLAALRCLGLRGRVTTELAGLDQVAKENHARVLLDTLRLMQEEMQNIHQSEAASFLNGELETGRPPVL